MNRRLLPFALLVSLATAVPARAQADAALPKDFAAFLGTMDAAQLELQNGRVAAYKALWSHRDDVTLSGGLGGAIEKGWPGVERRLDWVGTQFSKGSNRLERVVAAVSGDFAYVIQAEHLRYTVPGQSSETTRDYRVTMIFRKESGEWRIIHRHADTQTRPPSK
jgi:ketosteroid isomerase-like protein